MNTVNKITKRGYVINKDSISIKQLNYIKRELYVCPENENPFNIKYKVYRETQKSLLIPRFYGLQKIDSNVEDSIPMGTSIQNVIFNGTLRSETRQPEAVEKTVEHLQKYSGGILSLPTGYGKTTVALYILTQLKLRTIIFVHKEFLMNQWIEKIKQFLPNAEIGKIQGKTVDVVGKDIVIAMLQSVCVKEYHSSIFDGFGFTIIDETHHICTRVFSNIFFKLSTKYVLGLSATLDRKDGLTKVIHWFIGNVCFEVKRENQKQVLVEKINFTHDHYKNDFPLNRMQKVSIVDATSVIVNIHERNQMIEDYIKKCYHKGRKSIILTDRRDHCYTLFNSLKDQDYDVGLYIGGMKNHELMKSEKCKIIIATYSLAHEGLDIPTLDTLIMASPKVDITQSVGRILRETPGKLHDPLIIDIVDQWGCFISQFKKRMKVYKDTGFYVNQDKSRKDDKKLTGYQFVE